MRGSSGHARDAPAIFLGQEADQPQHYGKGQASGRATYGQRAPAAENQGRAENHERHAESADSDSHEVAPGQVEPEKRRGTHPHSGYTERLADSVADCSAQRAVSWNEQQINREGSAAAEAAPSAEERRLTDG